MILECITLLHTSEDALCLVPSPFLHPQEGLARETIVQEGSYKTKNEETKYET